MNYRLLSGIKGGDLTPFSFFEKFKNAQLKGRYLESNWIKLLNFDAPVLPVHIKSNQIMVLYVRFGTKQDFDNGNLLNNYIKANPFSVDDNTAMNCTHTQAHSAGNGFFVNQSPNPQYISWSYDLITFTSGAKVNADLIPTDYKVNLRLGTSATVGGSYNSKDCFNYYDLVRVIEINKGFDGLVIPYNNETAPADLHTSFYNLINNKFNGVTEMAGKRYMNYFIGRDVTVYGSRNGFVQPDSLFATALLSTNSKKTTSETYSNVQINPNTLILDISSKDEQNRVFLSQSNPTPANKYPFANMSGADLVFNSDFNTQMIIDFHNNLTGDVIGNIAFANQFSGDIETSTSDLYEFFNSFKSSDATSVPICNSILSLMNNTLSLPFWQRNEDVYVPDGGGIFRANFSTIFDSRFSSDIDPADYRSGKDIYDTTNEIYIQFY